MLIRNHARRVSGRVHLASVTRSFTNGQRYMHPSSSKGVGALDAMMQSNRTTFNGISRKYADFSTHLDQISNMKIGANKTGFIKNMDQVYHEYRSMLSQSETLDALKLHDLNVFISTFLKLGRLKRAHEVLEDLLRLDKSLVHGESRDISTVRNYLNLRCGSFHKLWYSDRGYEVTDMSYVYDLVEYSLEKGVSYWDTEIIHALGKMNRLELLSKFMQRKWGLALSDQGESSDTVECPPAAVTSAVVRVLCYAYDDGSAQSNKFLNVLIQRYPQAELDINFWRMLILEAAKAHRGSGVASASEYAASNENALDAWRAMKQWYGMRKQLAPFDYSITKEMYRVLEHTKDVRNCLDVYCSLFAGFYKQRNAIEGPEWALIYQYQKFILRRLVNKRKYEKAGTFISEWSLSDNNTRALQIGRASCRERV